MFSPISIMCALNTSCILRLSVVTIVNCTHSPLPSNVRFNNDYFKTYMHHFNGHSPDKPGFAVCPLDSQCPVTSILSILTGQYEALCTDMVEGSLGWTQPTYVNCHPRVSEQKFWLFKNKKRNWNLRQYQIISFPLMLLVGNEDGIQAAKTAIISRSSPFEDSA